MTSINLSSDQLSVLVAKSIMDGLNQETRDALISDAVKNFLNGKVSDRYGSVSHLQEMFNQAVVSAARKLVDEKLLNDESFQAQMNAVLAEAAAKAFSGDLREKMVASLSDGIRKGVTGRDY